MSSLIDIIQSQLTNSTVENLANKLGESPSKTQSALQEALPLLVGALSQKAQSPMAVSMISSFLDKDKDGSVIDDIFQMFTGGADTPERSAATTPSSESSMASESSMGGSLMQILLGNKVESVKGQVASASGLDMSSVAKLLPLLAPIILSSLSKMKSDQNLSSEGLASALEKQSDSAKQSASPESAGLLNQLLDSNNDGNVMDDVLRLGAKFLG